MNLCAALRNRANGRHVAQTKRSILEFSEDRLISNQKSIPTKLPAGTRSTYAISFSSCGNYVATSTGDHFVHILNTNNGEHIKTLSGHPRTCWSVVFHPNNSKLIASGDLSGEVRIWGIDGGSEVWRRPSNSPGDVPGERESNRVSLCFHPTDNLLLIAISNELHLWDWSHKPEPFTVIKTGSEFEKILYCRFSPCGLNLVTAISQHEPVIHPAIDLDNILTHDNMERLTAETPSTLHNYNFSEQIRQNSNTGNPQPESTNAMPILLMEEERNGVSAYMLQPFNSQAQNTATGRRRNVQSSQITLDVTQTMNPALNHHEAILQASISPRYDSFVRRRVAIDRIQSNLNRTSNTSSSSSTPNPNPPHNSTPQSVTPNFESNVASSPSDFLFRDYLLPSTTQNIQNLPSSTINIPFHRRINATSSDFPEVPTLPQSGPRWISPDDFPTDQEIPEARPSLYPNPRVRENHEQYLNNTLNQISRDQNGQNRIINRRSRLIEHMRRSQAMRSPNYYFRSENRRSGFAYPHGSHFRTREEKKLCRLQIWSFVPEKLPELSLAEEGLLLQRVKLNNDSSCSISADFSRIACFVQYPETRQRLQLTIVSLKQENLGDKLWTREFNSDALCVSISPLNNYIAIGMKVRRFSTQRDSPLIEFYKLTESGQNERVGSMKPRNQINGYPRIHQFVVNAISFMPGPGQGLMYGTSTGELNSVLPDCFEQVPSTATDSETSSDWPSLNNARTERIIRLRNTRENLRQTLDHLRRSQEDLVNASPITRPTRLPVSRAAQIRRTRSSQNPIQNVVAQPGQNSGQSHSLEQRLQHYHRARETYLFSQRRNRRNLANTRSNIPMRVRTTALPEQPRNLRERLSRLARPQIPRAAFLPDSVFGNTLAQGAPGYTPAFVSAGQASTNVTRSTYDDLTDWTRQAEDNRQQLLQQEERINRFSQYINNRQGQGQIESQNQIIQDLPRSIEEIATALRDTRAMVESFSGHLARLHAAMGEQRSNAQTDEDNRPPDRN